MASSKIIAEKEEKVKALSEELKDLNIKMISYNPDKRPNIEEILNTYFSSFIF